MKWKIKMYALNEDGRKTRRLRKEEILELARDYWDFCEVGEGTDYDKLLYYLWNFYQDWEIRKQRKQHIGFGIVEDFDWIMAVDDEYPSYGAEFIIPDENWTAIPEVVINRCLNSPDWDGVVFAGGRR